MIFDQANMEHQHALDAAFESGYLKGRREADEHVMADSAAVRERRVEDMARAHRDGFEAAVLCMFAAGSIIGVWGFITWVVWFS